MAETQQKPITEQFYDIWFQLQLLFIQTCCQKPTLEPGPLCPRHRVGPCPKAPSLKYKTTKDKLGANGPERKVLCLGRQAWSVLTVAGLGADTSKIVFHLQCQSIGPTRKKCYERANGTLRRLAGTW